MTSRLNPITLKRLRRFRGIRRAWWAFVLLLAAYVVSLGAELVCGSTPLYVRHRGRSYFPIFRFYPDDTFTASGRNTRPDYRKIAAGAAFREIRGNWMLFPLIPYGPYDTLEPGDLRVPEEVTVTLVAEPHVASVNVRSDDTLERTRGAGFFFGVEDDAVDGLRFSDMIALPDEVRAAIERRFRNEAAERVEQTLVDKRGRRLIVSLSAFTPRQEPPSTVRLRLTEPADARPRVERLVFDGAGRPTGKAGTLWRGATVDERERLASAVRSRFAGPVERETMTLAGERVVASFDKTDVRFPFRPMWPEHPLGIDDAGRDVLARIIYGFRISMSFALLLVVTSMVLGTAIGAVQGYFGGMLDIGCQRLIEIWSALPFLYVVILLGSVFGRSFLLLLGCYGIFNWIGISYYMRAEFLRLRRQQFVESARCLGVSTAKILFLHILPNALVPIVTFFPFQLVGAIGALAALDYLGFGMPPPTSSWGELLNQAGMYRWAWWLILYPSLALFLVILMGVFVGEGLRAAFDPRDYRGEEPGG